MSDLPKDSIPALSVRQPWAELIILGKKSIEIRSWSTNYRGKLWIHAGRTVNKRLEEFFKLSGLFHGGYIGSVILEDVFPFEYTTWKQWQSQHLDPGNYEPGSYAWILSNPIRFEEPVPGSGNTYLFPVLPEKEKLFREKK